MTLCPIALVAGCRRCPIVALCPLKGVIGDDQKPEKPTDADAERPAQKKK